MVAGDIFQTDPAGGEAIPNWARVLAAFRDFPNNCDAPPKQTPRSSADRRELNQRDHGNRRGSVMGQLERTF
jgi:hypothetical protein